MENENDNLLDKKYIILKKKGGGGSAKVFVVKEIDKENIYAAKVLKDFNSYEKNRNVEKMFNNEKDILLYLHDNIKNSYIINYINSGEGEIIRTNKPTSINKYLILEYAEKGCLLDYIIFPKNGLNEKYSKLLFSKILKGIKACHEANVYHRDIKLENILLDDNYNPKICDFGLGKLKQKKAIEPVGTLKYAAPEVLANKLYDSSKIDIFSLGVTLFYLVNNSTGFNKATESDDFYSLIKKENYDNYWDELTKIGKGMGLSEEFKKLYFKMVSFNPKNRPNIDEILNSEWMKEIKELNEEQIKQLENEKKLEFIKREKNIKEEKQKNIVYEEKSSVLFDNRSGGDDITEYFESNLKPKIIEIEDNMNNFIKIKGNLNPVNFMNKLANKISAIFDNNCLINPNKNSLKFDIIFEEEENEEEEEEEQKEEEEKKEKKCNNYQEIKEFNENNEENNNRIRKKDCVIQVKLFELKNGEYLLRFVKKEGELEEFYKIFEKISNSVKNMI